MRNYTDITILLDRSGSMASIQESVVRGINAFVEEQKRIPGEGCWSFVYFDDQATARGAGEEFPLFSVEAKDQSFVPLMTVESFKPRGNTALIDAACLTIERIGKRLAAMPEQDRPSKVLVVIMTDGQENASLRNRAALNEMISHQKTKYNWSFLFLGANQDAVAEGGKYGIAKGASFTYQANHGGTLAACGLVSRSVRDWKADGNQSAAQFLSSIDPDPQPPAPSVVVNVNNP